MGGDGSSADLLVGSGREGEADEVDLWGCWVILFDRAKVPL
jgi:hypothetical protein